MAKRKSRWWRRLIGVVVVLGLLAGVAEFALRLILPGIIASAIRVPLQMPADQPVEVELGGSALLHAVQGQVGDIVIEIPGAPLIDGFTADAVIRADSVPFNPFSGRITGAAVELKAPSEELDAIVELATQGIAQTGRVSDGDLLVGRNVEAFGQELAVTAKLSLTIIDGSVRIQPRSVNAAGFDITAEELSNTSGELLDPMLVAHTVCVRDQLPRGLTLTKIDLRSDGAASITAKLSPTILSDPKQQKLGSCA